MTEKTTEKAKTSRTTETPATETSSAKDTQEVSREVPFVPATATQAKNFYAGNPERGRRYKLGQQGGQTVLMISKRG